MSRSKSVSLLALPLAAGIGGLLALAMLVAPARGQGDQPESSCQPGLDKSANPSSLILGQGSSQVTMAMTHTCGAERLPVDMMFVVDVSNSMMQDDANLGMRTPGSGIGDPTKGVPTPKVTPDPGGEPTAVPPPGPIPPPDPVEPPGGSRVYDPCTARPIPPGGGGVVPILPTGGAIEPPGVPGPGKGTPTDEPLPTKPVKPTPTGSSLRDPIPEPFGSQDNIREVRDAITDFLRQNPVEADLQSGRLRTGLVSFADSGRRLQRLSENPNGVRTALSRLRGGGISQIDQGLRLAEQELTTSAYGGKGGDADRVKIMAVYSDGKFCPADVRRGGSRRDQIQVIAIGVGRDYDRGNMQQLASQRDYLLELREIKELTLLYTKVIPTGRPVTMDTLTITEVLSPDVAYVPDSANPVPSEVLSHTLKWTFAPPTTPLTITYGVEPLVGGFISVSASSSAEWLDSASLTGAGSFPDTYLDVLVPTPTVTPTPTATNTPTATSTPVPEPRYLPFLVNRWPPAEPPSCVPEQQTIDVALVVDTSTSMSDPTQAGGLAKLEAAIDAGKGLLDLLKFPADGTKDQAAVISFNHDAATVIQLSNDPIAVALALDELRNRQAVGTRIDLGLTQGLLELDSPRHRPGNKRAVILVTDGRQTDGGTDAQVITAAQAIKDQGITLWTVALGNDADVALLQAAATSPQHFKFAPNAEGLRLIYEEIARVIPCDDRTP